MESADRRHDTRRRLAALGALSSAGLALAGAEAEAGIVVTTVNHDIGFATGDVSSFALSALPGANGNVVIKTATYAPGHSHSLLVSGKPGNVFRIGASLLSTFLLAQRFNKGATLNQANLKTPAAFISAANNTTGPIVAPFTDKYFLFSFQDVSQGNKVLYGWIEGSLTDNTHDKMTYHLTAYAYDNTGAVIKAGDTGTAAVPEPGAATLGLLGAALVGGAAGVRRWKKARAEAAPTTG